MKQTPSILRTLLTLVTLLALLGLQSGLQAQTGNNFRVTLDTHDLIGQGGHPFSVYYDLTNGSGADNGANVALDNFNFGAGGSWSGPSSILLTETAGGFDTSFLQAFTPGDLLTFDVHISSLSDDTPPDLFSFAIQDVNGIFLPTTGSDPNNPDFVGADVYLSIPLLNGTTLADIQNHDVFAGLNDGTVTGRLVVDALPTSNTPEGGSASLLLSGLGGAAFFAWRRKHSEKIA